MYATPRPHPFAQFPFLRPSLSSRIDSPPLQFTSRLTASSLLSPTGEHQAAMQTNRGTTLLGGPGGNLGVLLLSLSLLHGLQRLQIKRL